MKNIRLMLLFMFTAAPLSWAAQVSADAIRYNRCDLEGADCANGLPAGVAPGTSGPLSPGVCRKTTCSRPSPDGVIVYDCLLCIATASPGGATGAGGRAFSGGRAATGGAFGTGGGGSSGGIVGAGGGDDASDQGCSCGAPGAAKPWSLAVAMLLLGLVVLGGSRRRSR